MDGKAHVFNGNGNIAEFIAKVELYSALKEYDDEKHAQNLASRLEGPIFDVYLRLDQDDRPYETLSCQILLLRFRQSSTTHVCSYSIHESRFFHTQ